MNKAGLVGAIADRTTGINRDDINELLNVAIAVIIAQVASGSEVRLLGFGTFHSKGMKARMGRNPQTGEPMDIAAQTVPRFRPGAGFKQKVKGADDE